MQLSVQHNAVEQGRSRSVVAGNLIFLSGVGSQAGAVSNAATDYLELQVTAMLDKVRTAIEEAGGSQDNLIKTTLYLENMEDYIRVRQAELDYYKKHASLLETEPPASTAIQVTSFSEQKCRVGIDAVGVVKRDCPGWEVRKYTNPAYKKPFVSQFAAVGNLVFCSGMDARRPDLGRVPSNNIEDQMQVSFDKIRLCMEKAGGTMNDIIKLTRYIKDILLIPRMWKTEQEYFRKYAPALLVDPPASTLVQASLTSPDYLIEMEAIGVVPQVKTCQDD